MLSPQPGKDDADGDADREELTAVMKRLRDAKPPQDVLKVPAIPRAKASAVIPACRGSKHHRFGLA